MIAKYTKNIVIYKAFIKSCLSSRCWEHIPLLIIEHWYKIQRGLPYLIVKYHIQLINLLVSLGFAHLQFKSNETNHDSHDWMDPPSIIIRICLHTHKGFLPNVEWNC